MTASDDSRTQTIARIGELVRQTESIADPAARGAAIDLLQAVMELHAAALDRMLEVISGASNTNVISAIAADSLVSSVLVLHGLHPLDTETRVRAAFEKLRTFFDVRGAGLSLVSADNATVHVRFQGSRPGSAQAARQVIEDAFYEAAPEIAQLIIDGVDERPEPGFVPLTQLAAQKI